MANQVKNIIKEVLEEAAKSIETGSYGIKPKIGLTIDGSEHGLDVMQEAVILALDKGLFDIVLIGSKVEWDIDVEHVFAKDASETHMKMEKMLVNGDITGCVTLHYSFPIGVSTVGRVITPAKGKEMFIATTTGTTSASRNEALLLNAINGIAVAKAVGYKNPTVGILNIDGANSIVRALTDLKNNGYNFTFGESKRTDGGYIIRGNDLLMGSVDVVVCDSLTGNFLMKMFAAYTTGGNYEALGYGYGPGVGDNYHNNICIISRASGAPVIANALYYSYQLAKNNISKLVSLEYSKAKEAGLSDILLNLNPKRVENNKDEIIKPPTKEVVTKEISGIDVMDLDIVVSILWKYNIYAESGMGCTGPIILVNEHKIEQAKKVIKDAGY